MSIMSVHRQAQLNVIDTPSPVSPAHARRESQRHAQIPRWRRIATLRGAVLLCAVGLAIQEIAYQLSLHGSEAGVQPLFFIGLLLIYTPCVAVLVRQDISRNSRLVAGLLLAESLFASQWLAHPLLPVRYDELLHLTSLWQLVDGRHFFATNPLVPISPYYPGLELITAGLHWTTGLPGAPSEFLIVIVARALLIVALFLVVERITHSGRMAGLAIALYMANPQFYDFDAQYTYETLALALALIAVHYALRAIDKPDLRPQFISASGVALALLAITHHVTSWAMLLALISAALWLGIIGKRSAARVFIILACIDAVFVGGWSAFVGRRIATYFGPILDQAVDSVTAILFRRARIHTLFLQATGTRTPQWEVAIITLSLIVWAGLLLAAIASSRGRHLLSENRALWLIAVGAMGYLEILISHISTSTAQFGERSSSLIFFFVAILVAIWWVHSGYLDRPRYFALSLLALSLLAIGGLLLGTSDYQRVPGTYLVEADQRSIDSYSMAAAQWAQAHIPADTRIAADRDNAALMAAVGHLFPVSHTNGSVNVTPLYFAKTIGVAQEQMVQQGKIGLLLVDDRLSTSLPYDGFYFEPPNTTEDKAGNVSVQELTPEELNKFNTWSGVRRIYHNGPISIFDLSKIEGLSPIKVSSQPSSSGDLNGMGWPALGGSLVLGSYLLLTRRREKRTYGDPIETVLDAAFGVIMLFAIVGLSLVVFKWPPIYVVGPVLILLFVAFIRSGRVPRTFKNLEWPRKSFVAIGLSAGLLTALSISVSIGTAAR